MAPKGTPETTPETTPGSSPRGESPFDEEVTTCHVVVKGTFIELSDGSSMMSRFKKFRKSKTDSALPDGDDVREVELQLPALPQVQPEKAEPQASPVKRAMQKLARTTVMLRNIPNNYTRQMFLELLDDQGFWGSYDFVYLPCDFQRDSNLGYAFVNLQVDSVDRFWDIFDGFSRWSLPSAKVCEVTWSGPHQGLNAHVERYRNSPVMHRSVPEKYKPMVFAQGDPVPFPPPTRRLKAPTTR